MGVHDAILILCLEMHICQLDILLPPLLLGNLKVSPGFPKQNLDVRVKRVHNGGNMLPFKARLASSKHRQEFYRDSSVGVYIFVKNA